MRYAGEKKLNIWIVMALGILALFLLFVVYPLVLVLYKSVLTEEGKLSLATLQNSLQENITGAPW